MEIDENTLFATIGRLYVRSQQLAVQLQQTVSENRRLTQENAILSAPATEGDSDGLPD